MKILAIRGKNLASLAGEFSIDFLEQPLASAGLFAISGPTGSGKSTLLDTLCLALFDKTPRLQQAGSKGVHLRDVGDETLPPHDARNLLRRGSAEGYAEVEFIGNDRQHYRCRWSVRRARLRADGKLQASEMTLFRLPELQAIGGKKTEVQDAIIEKLGLNFDQFTRAVLLAQNEFSVFLKAGDDERASLLETLTGTGQYSDISKRAFERAKLERQKLDALLHQLAARQPLAENEREALLEQIRVLQDGVNHAQQQKATIETHLNWHQRNQELQTAELDAQSRVGQAQDEHLQSQARRDYLSLIESLQAGRPLLVDHDRLHGECQRQQQQLDAAETAVATAVDSQQSTMQKQKAAEQYLQATEQRKAEAEVEIVKARALDVEINTLLPQHLKQQQDLLQARHQLSELQGQCNDAQQKRQQTELDLVECSAWLDSNAGLARLSEQWPRWDTLFKQSKTISHQLDAARSLCSKSEASLSLVQETVKTVQVQLDGLQSKVSEANQRRETAESHAKPFDADALTAEHGQHEFRLSQLRKADSCWLELTKLNSTSDNQHQALHALKEQRQQSREGLEVVISRLPALVASHEQAAKMLDLAKLACSENVETLRTQLQPGSECPVCGSTQHPFASEAHPLREELKALETEVQACLQRRKQAEQEKDRLNLDIQQIDKQAEAASGALETLATQIAEQRKLWDVHAESLGCSSMADESITPWLIQQTKAEEQAQRVVSDRLKAMGSAFSARDQARQALEEIIQQQYGFQQQLDRAKADQQTAQIALDNAKEKQKALAKQLEQQMDELDAAFEGSIWRQDWLADAESFYQRYLQQAQDWRTRQVQREQLTNQLAIQQTSLAGLRSSVAQTETHLDAAADSFGGIDAELSNKQQQRQAILNGRSVTEVDAELAKALNEAKVALQAAITAAHAATTQAATAQETVSQLRNILVARQAQSATAELQLTQWLQGFALFRPELPPLSLLDLRQHLQHDADWLTRERQVLQQLDQTLAQAQTVLNERRQQCEKHLHARSSLESRDSLETQLLALSVQLEELARQHGELNLQRRMDDERLQASAGLQVQITSQTAVNNTWAKLSSIIGSADGKRFRNIAQQLTLDILLGYANQHLKDLSRRYRLERVGDTLALQVVDQDMGDEIRSVHSLSGGESFLLSLALALGLASLSSNRVCVESLFIDEGFGSLDAETLRVAMDALDSLQSLGRKVGVISHVQEMTERIGTRIEVKRVGSGLGKVSVC
ncbi:AAA family ATPase [Methylomicrobium sp. Wu6]|uniref:AAA family ATPase n=1 Tax=Methylomicrobium sp. Wu6 TaxID=3107928 RepID=UPI002DD67E38|nr:AAA family ATPase [Methylomicrobium sp. Wu6]MEC4746988.1 AAA family ATPase [Methylomicrobium sp. Wu6]